MRACIVCLDVGESNACHPLIEGAKRGIQETGDTMGVLDSGMALPVGAVPTCICMAGICSPIPHWGIHDTCIKVCSRNPVAQNTIFCVSSNHSYAL